MLEIIVCIVLWDYVITVYIKILKLIWVSKNWISKESYPVRTMLWYLKQRQSLPIKTMLFTVIKLIRMHKGILPCNLKQGWLYPIKTSCLKS